MGSVPGRSPDRGLGFPVAPEIGSFLLFFALSLVGAYAFYGEYPVFLVLLIFDSLATLIDSDLMVSVDRSAYLLAVVVLGVAQGPYNFSILFLEVIAVVTALDFSVFLRTLRETVVDSSVVKRRLESYGYTALPAFLLSYLLTLLYSAFSLSGAPGDVLLLLLAVSSTLGLLAIYALSRLAFARRF